MLSKILYSLTGNHHRFRHMTFDELGEIYTSMMLRSLAMGMAGIFIPIYLYQNGYEIWEIFTFFSLYFLIGAIICVPIAKMIALIGPKHTILISYFFQIGAMTSLIFIDYLGNYYLTAVLYAFANVAFFSALHVDFSKIKHSKKGGSELGWLYIAERVGAVSGPLVGGLLAYMFSPKYTFAVSVVVLLLAIVPLLLTKEAIRVHQKLEFHKLKLREIKYDITSYSFFCVEAAVSVVVWPLFIAVIVFKDNPYVQLGSIVSISIVISLIFARMIGKIVDNRRGRELLRFNTVVNAVLHLFRAFTPGYSTALAINMLNEGVTAGYRMPYFKGMYDAADDHPGYRIVYIAILEIFSLLARSSFFALAAVGAYLFTADRIFFGALFLAGAISSLIIMLEHYPALKPRRHWYGKA